jgi:hypothetical protein
LSKKHTITISADPSFKRSELEEIGKSLESEFDVQLKEFERLSGEDLVPYLLIAFGLIAVGFFSQAGADTWNAFKTALGIAVEKKEQPTNIHFQYDAERKKADLEVTTNHAKVIGRAFDLIGATTEKLVSDGERYYFAYENREWKLTSVE